MFRVLKSMTQMESNAKECLAKFDLENGLIYYWRATNIGIEFLKRTKLKKGDNVSLYNITTKYCVLLADIQQNFCYCHLLFGRIREVESRTGKFVCKIGR